MSPLDSDIAHLLAGSMVLVSFLLLYQDRMFALLNFFALHAIVLALSVGWQAYLQDAPHLFITALIALLFKAVLIPVALHRIVVRLGIHRTIETVVSIGPTMLFGMALVSLENGLVLAATGARGMPLVVEISVGFSVLIAFIVIGIFLFRIRERFDTVDLQALDMSRGETAGSESA